jgi:hypothetical protein
MATVESSARFSEEVADLFASCPAPAQVLAFHPSDQVQKRAAELLEKNRNRELTPQERTELDRYEQTELILQLVKARVRAQNVSQA